MPSGAYPPFIALTAATVIVRNGDQPFLCDGPKVGVGGWWKITGSLAVQELKR
jgi:hypothetical protein